MKKVNWTKQMLKEGFDRFLLEYGHYPTVHEVDKSEYLPSSRWIQMSFGGLQKLRDSLGYTHTHFGQGAFRSKIANTCNRRGRNSEIKLEEILVDTFGEVFVHTEKIFSALKTRVDFYVYTPEGNFGADIFYPNNIRTLQSIVNIKMSKYIEFKEPLYFVVANEDIFQDSLDTFVSRKKNKFPNNLKLVTLKVFLHMIQKRNVYPNPII